MPDLYAVVAVAPPDTVQPCTVFQAYNDSAATSHAYQIANERGSTVDLFRMLAVRVGQAVTFTKAEPDGA